MSDANATPRRDYLRAALDEAQLAEDPFVQFGRWFEEARATVEIVEASAMTLATVGAQGRPSARVVLLRGIDSDGFAFFTNYESQKGRELEMHPFAALTFYWAALERQVRIEGNVVRLAPEESDAYFASRPRGHRISAWASEQSQTVTSRAALEEALALTEERFEGVEVPRPPHWGGYRVMPERFEFWQGRANRAHDRIVYERAGPAAWRILRLWP